MKVEVSVECLPRVGPGRKDNWYVVVVFGHDAEHGELPWNKKAAEAICKELHETLVFRGFSPGGTA